MNILLTAGQLIYGGLVAIGDFFVALGEAIVVWGMGRIDTYVPALVQGWETVPRAAEIPEPFSSSCDPGVSHSDGTSRTCRLHGPGGAAKVASGSWVSYLEPSSREGSSSSTKTVS
ncbi:MAG: hypothetical protein V3U33_04015, partial [candidate division NC10 bacterium]